MSIAAPARGAEEAETDRVLRSESLGGLRIELPESEVLKLLGPPAKRSKLVVQEVDSTYEQDWTYPEKGIELSMTTGAKKTGAKKIVRITASAPRLLATRKGIKIGSAEPIVRKAYAADADREMPPEPGVFVVGSVYGGIIFNFEKGKVSRIFFGAAAE